LVCQSDFYNYAVRLVNVKDTVDVLETSKCRDSRIAKDIRIVAVLYVRGDVTLHRSL
jgi:hypothetical protein